jgi:predicted phage tail protein
MATGSKSSFLSVPSTRLGWWAFVLGAAFIVMFFINAAVFMRLPDETPWRTTVLPFYGILMMASGLLSGILGLIAVIQKKELSILVWATLLPGVFVIFFLLGEFLFPH